MTALLALQAVKPHGTLAIRNLNERTKAQLRMQAARHGRSMEEEARKILRTVIESSQAEGQVERLGSRIHAHFAGVDGVELDLPKRSSAPAAAEFEPR